MGKRNGPLPELERACPECHSPYPASRHKCPACGAGFRSTLWRREAELESDEGGTIAGVLAQQSGVAGGVIMIIVAVVWFAMDDHESYVYLYPPILALWGLGAVLYGLRRIRVRRRRTRPRPER